MSVSDFAFHVYHHSEQKGTWYSNNEGLLIGPIFFILGYSTAPPCDLVRLYPSGAVAGGVCVSAGGLIPRISAAAATGAVVGGLAF
ncbi:unnamed protein product [Calypogeia fissa]